MGVVFSLFPAKKKNSRQDAQNEKPQLIVIKHINAFPWRSLRLDERHYSIYE